MGSPAHRLPHMVGRRAPPCPTKVGQRNALSLLRNPGTRPTCPTFSSEGYALLGTPGNRKLPTRATSDFSPHMGDPLTNGGASGAALSKCIPALKKSAPHLGGAAVGPTAVQVGQALASGRRRAPPDLPSVPDPAAATQSLPFSAADRPRPEPVQGDRPPGGGIGRRPGVGAGVPHHRRAPRQPSRTRDSRTSR